MTQTRKYKEGYTTSETADILGITRAYVWSLIRQGRIKAKKLGRDFVVTPKELEHLKNTGIRPIQGGLRK